MHNRIAPALVASLLVVSASAMAKGKSPQESLPPNTEVKEREARKACLSGDYATGVAILSDLFLDTKVATYIFNQGRCYEQNERYEEAISRFREFQRTSNVDKDVAQTHIAECEALLQKKKAAASIAPGPMPTGVPAVSVAPVADQPQPTAVGTTVTTTAQPVAAAGSGLRKAGLIAGGVGVVSVLAGVGLNYQANQEAAKIMPPKTFDRGTESTRKSYETFSWVGYGVGAAGILTGAILYGLGWGSTETVSVACIPEIGPGMTGASLRRVF